MACEYILIDIFATTNIVIAITTNDIAISCVVAIPIITLNGIQNGDDIGNIAANLFNSLVGFIIVKYAK